MLSADRLTVKAAEALQAAAHDARKRGNAEIHGVHLLSALLQQDEGIVVPILQKLEVPVAVVGQRAGEAIDRFPDYFHDRVADEPDGIHADFDLAAAEREYEEFRS